MALRGEAKKHGFEANKLKICPKNLSNISKIKKDIKWKPRISIIEGIERLFQS